MAMHDPYPGKSFCEARDALRARFPNGSLDYHPTNGEVFVSLPLKDGGDFRAGLTWKQAKYLAYSDLTGDDLKDGRFPANWPK